MNKQQQLVGRVTNSERAKYICLHSTKGVEIILASNPNCFINFIAL